MRTFNFSAGPGLLPQSVLRRIAAEMTDWNGTGRSILEANHRSPEVRALVEELEAGVRSLLSVPDAYDVLFTHGGGRMQFAMVPMNLLRSGRTAVYVESGAWSRAAASEAERFGRVERRSPKSLSAGGTVSVPEDAAYLYYCDNETVDGLEFRTPPSPSGADVPLVADLSSNFMSRPLDVARHGLVWAAAQKNFGAAGLAVVILRRDLLGGEPRDVPTLLRYEAYAETESMPNTPAVFQLYVSNLMARWIASEGGVAEMAARAEERARLVYGALDECADVYATHPDAAARSRMNVVFRLRDEALTAGFLRAAEAEGLQNLAGHRSVGGLRASLYNAMPIEGAARLADFIRSFALRHPRPKLGA